MSTVTAAELAHRAHPHGVRITAQITLGFLHDWEVAGVAERVEGRWRLTRSGRAMFGAWIAAPLQREEDEGA